MNRLRTYLSRSTQPATATGRRSARRAPRAHKPGLGQTPGHDALPTIPLSIR